MKRSLPHIAGFLGAAALFLFVPIGCAKSPANVSASGPQLIITMTVNQAINPAYHYYVLFNNSNDSTGSVGPIPVVAAPWGNGFATGSGTNAAGLTGYVVFDSTQNPAQGGGFGAYTVIPGSLGRQFSFVGPPLQTSVTSNTLQFRIPLSYLATTAVPTANINYLQINFLATDSVPVGGTDNNTEKYFDALGDSNDISGVNSYITISTTKSGIYQNSDKQIEPSYPDVSQAGNGGLKNINEPDLDITNWSVEVRD